MTDTKEIITKYTNDPICPRCGHRYGDAWEIDFGDDAEGNTVLTCHGCGEDFQVFRHVEITYSTYTHP